MTEIKKGACHCGAITFEVILDNGLENLRRCNCSLCRRKGSIIASVPLPKLTITQGEDKLSVYQWNTKTAKHYFCSICGIYTHHQRRSDPNEFGFNVACIEGVDPFELDSVHPETPTLRKAQQFGGRDEKRNLLIHKPSDFAGLLLSCQLAAGNGVSGQTLDNIGIGDGASQTLQAK